MARALILFGIIAFSATSTFGMDCNFGQSTNIIEQIIKSCPRPLQSSAKSYCCLDPVHESFYCCDEQEFLLKTGLGFVVPVVITAAVIISLLIFCISCLCCSWCPWYRRRHRGTVYGKVQAPGIVHVVHQSPAIIPQQVPYQTHSTGMPQPTPPPMYTESYAKQAPYNPDYRQ